MGLPLGKAGAGRAVHRIAVDEHGWLNIDNGLLNVAFSEGGVQVGCTHITWAAWYRLTEKAARYEAEIRSAV